MMQTLFASLAVCLLTWFAVRAAWTSHRIMGPFFQWLLAAVVTYIVISLAGWADKQLLPAFQTKGIVGACKVVLFGPIVPGSEAATEPADEPASDVP